MNSNRSRLKRRVENQVKKEMVFFILGTILLLFLLLKFGVGVITQIGGLFVKINELESSNNQMSSTTNFLIPPVLDPIPSATNSATLDISGKSTEKDGIIQLFINMVLTNETILEKDGKFIFQSITLQDGENIVQVRIKRNSDVSGFSKEYHVTYNKNEPKLEIIAPVDNSTFSKENQDLTIQGKTDPDNKVTINGYRAIVNNDGTFSYLIKLNSGDNIIQIEAEDPAGNKSKKELKLFYQP